MIMPILLAVVGAVIIVAAVYDAATLTIPNWLSLALIGLFPAAALFAGISFGDAGLHLAVGVVALVVGMVMFSLNWIGGGDAKFFAAVSLYVGLASVGDYLMVVVIAGGALSIVLLGARWVAKFGVPMDWFLKFTRGGSVIPYGIAIAFGGLAVLPETQIFSSALI
jgi:prepilin peptidase CpaA